MNIKKIGMLALQFAVIAAGAYISSPAMQGCERLVVEADWSSGSITYLKEQVVIQTKLHAPIRPAVEQELRKRDPYARVPPQTFKVVESGFCQR